VILDRALLRSFLVMRRSVPGRESGFSLIEVLVVIGVVGIVATATWDRLSQLAPKYRLSGAARSAAAEVQRARTRAISEGKCAKVSFDAVAKTIQVGVGPTPTSGGCAAATYTFEPLVFIDDTRTIGVESAASPGNPPVNPIFNSRGGGEPTGGVYPSIRFYNVLGDGRLVLVNAAGRVNIQ
jgi:prepilin-type N-terminal cleavage/methylation domain-containing protein